MADASAACRGTTAATAYDISATKTALGSPALASLYNHDPSDRLPLSVLQRWQAKALLPSSSVPPLDRGRIWSRVGAAIGKQQ
jgi:hypothetical protein